MKKSIYLAAVFLVLIFFTYYQFFGKSEKVKEKMMQYARIVIIASVGHVVFSIIESMLNSP